MRGGIVLALICMIACAPAPKPRVLMAEVERDVDQLARRYPIGATANLRTDEIGRTPGTSVHLVQVRGGESPHRHGAHDLAVTVLRGEGVLHVAGVERPMRAGDAAIVPRGVAHWYTNRGTTPSIAVAVFTPALDAPDSQPLGGVDSREGAR